MPLCLSGLRGRPGGTDSEPAGIMGKLHNKQAFYTAFLNIRILTAFVKQKNKKIPPEGDIFVLPSLKKKVFPLHALIIRVFFSIFRSQLLCLLEVSEVFQGSDGVEADAPV